MKNFLLMLLSLMMTAHIAFAQSGQDELHELMSDIEQEFWINGNYGYVYESIQTALSNLDYEDSEQASLYLYAGLSGIYRGYLGDKMRCYLEKAIQIATNAYCENSRIEGLALMGLAQIIGNSDIKEAIPYDRKAISIIEATCGENSIEAAVAEQCLAYHLGISGDAKAGKESFASAEKRFVKGKAGNSLLYARFLTERAFFWTLQKNGDMAFKELEKSIDLINISSEHEKGLTEITCNETLVYYLSMTVYIYNAFGLYKEAADVGKNCIDLMEKYGLDDNSNYAANLCNLGAAYIFLKDFKTAAKWYEKAKKTYETLGETDSTGYKNVVKTIDWMNSQQ